MWACASQVAVGIVGGRVSSDDCFVVLVAATCAELPDVARAHGLRLLEMCLQLAMPSAAVENAVEAAMYAVGRPDLVRALHRCIYGALVGQPFAACGLDEVFRHPADDVPKY